MNWQEYQEAVGELYAQMEGIGQVYKNITLPDKITGHPRQIDVWLELEAKTHKLGILIDAKYRKEKIDVKDVEEVLSLGQAVGANMWVLVALNGWSEPARIKADAVGMDLRLFTLEQALDLIVPDKWIMCPVCENDCIVLDFAGGMVVNGMWSLMTSGRCRECLTVRIWCWDCGDRFILKHKEQVKCGCGHAWKNNENAILVKTYGRKRWIEVTNSTLHFDPESAEAHIKNGLAHKSRGAVPEAIDEFTKAIEAAPISAVAYYHRAITYDEHGQIEKALEDYSTAIDLHPEFAMAYGSRGIAYYALGQYAMAIEDFEQYLHLEPNSPDREMIENAIHHARSDSKHG